MLVHYENAPANEISFKPEVLCEPNHYGKWNLLSLKSAHLVDVNSDSVDELLVHMQFNNNGMRKMIAI